MLNTPFSPWPAFTAEEADAVRDVLLSNRVNYWTGNQCRNFETEFAEWCGVDYAISLANGTVALEAALRVVGVGSGDEVVVPSRTFVGTASSIVAVGAIPVFADVDRDSQTITAASVAAVLTPRTKAVICVHLAGWPCDMDPIIDLARRHGLFVVEDCAQAHGARYKDRLVGSIGHVGAWSFCQDKIMTTGGEGGMVTTNDKDLWSKMWSLKDHGRSWSKVYGQESTPPWIFRWVCDAFGTNWRMTEMQAAIGRIQLRRMAEWHVTRLKNARAIWNSARNLPGLRVPTIPSDVEHAAYKCYVFVEPGQLGPEWSRDRILGEIVARGVPAYSGACSEVYLEPAFEGTGWRPVERLPVARELGETSMMFLVHPTLSDAEIRQTCMVLSDVMHASVA